MRVNEQAVKNILKSVGNAKLVAATKYVGIEEINELEKLGVKSPFNCKRANDDGTTY